MDTHPSKDSSVLFWASLKWD